MARAGIISTWVLIIGCAFVLYKKTRSLCASFTAYKASPWVHPTKRSSTAYTPTRCIKDSKAGWQSYRTKRTFHDATLLLRIGETVNGTVLRNLGTKRYRVDVGKGREVDLTAGELRDGFPVESARLKTGDEITARVLRIVDRRVWLTRRSGSLDRPPWEYDKLKSRRVSAFVGVPSNKWFFGEVVEMSLFAVWVKLTPDIEGEPCVGMVHKDEFYGDFVDRASYGMQVRVRIVKVDEGRNTIDLTMKP